MYTRGAGDGMRTESQSRLVAAPDAQAARQRSNGAGLYRSGFLPL
jgi:hypothetical protein